MTTICPVTEDKCPYQKILIDGVCEDQLTCPVVEYSFKEIRKTRLKVSKKLSLILFIAFLLVLLLSFLSLYFFTDIIRNKTVTEAGYEISTMTESEFIVYIKNDVSIDQKEDTGSELQEITVVDRDPVSVKRLNIPSLSLYAEITAVGLNKYNLIELFPSREVVSWYENSVLPGQPGNCILVGNKYYQNFTAVFNLLDRIEINDEIIFTLDNGQKVTQKVYDIIFYQGSILPAKVLELSSSYPITTIISKAGDINLSTGDFDSYIVVLSH